MPTPATLSTPHAVGCPALLEPHSSTQAAVVGRCRASISTGGLSIVLVMRSPPAETRGAVNTTRTFLIALEADPRLLLEFGSAR
jgi:hypothetical protein